MADRLSQLESQVGELSSSLHDVEQRLSRLEERLTTPFEPAGAAADVAPAPPPGAPSAPAASDFVTVLALIGRTLLGLAGAYLLRALTSEGLLPQAVGVAAGLLYAALWILLADVTAGRGRTASAAFHGATAPLVAIPLIWETTVRFELLSPAAAAAALSLLTALSLAIAWRHGLRSLAWIISIGAGFAALMLGGTTQAPVPFTAFLVLLGVATLWLAQDRPWHALPWVTAALADLAVLLLVAEAPIAKELASVGGVLTVQLALFVLYAASFAAAAHRRQREIGALGGLQTLAAVLVGYGGALVVIRQLPAGVTLLGVASGLAAVALYGVAFAVVEREQKRNALFYAGVALPLVLGGSHLLLARPAFLWSLLAIASAGLGSRLGRLILSQHAVLYALAASAASGLIRQAGQSWTASGDGAWPRLAADGLLALLAVVACLAFPVRGDLDFWRRWAGLPQLALLILAAWAGGGTLIRTVGPLLAAEPGSAADPAALATVRTAILAAAALALAWLGRASRFREASKLVYPALLLGAVKLLIEDFPAGRPDTLFLALAFYGGALILAPRLRRLPGG